MRNPLLAIAASLVAALLAFAIVRSVVPVRGVPPLPREGFGSNLYLEGLGADVFRRYCVTCHGTEGKGDGFNAFNLQPRPRDLTRPEFQKAKKDRDLIDAVEKGGSAIGQSPAMPPFGRTLSPREVRAVVRYIRGLTVQP